MNTPRLKVVLVTVLAVIFGLPATSFAWWGFVHYRIAKDIAGVDPDYAMGPDTFASHSLGVIQAEFTWSHAVMASDLDFPPPDIPQYPHDGRYPGKVMYDLVTKKLRPTTLASMEGANVFEQSPIETARGFVVHNASDNVVHWQYFLGGDTPAICNEGILWMWQTHHAFKEEWASYIVLMLKDARTNGGTGVPIQLYQGPGVDNVMGTSDDIFSSLSSSVNGEPDYTNDVFGADGFLQPYLLATHAIAFKTNADLQNLAMKAYRKNRRNTDIDGIVGFGTESSEFFVQGAVAIAGSFDTNITNGDAAMNELSNMTLARFLELNGIASAVNAANATPCGIPRWHPADVMSRYDQCVVRGAAWLAGISD